MDFYKKWLMWTLIVVVLLALLIAFFIPKQCGGEYNIQEKPFVSHTECSCFGLTGTQLYNLLYSDETPGEIDSICFGICRKSSCIGKIIFKNDTPELDLNNCSSIGGKFCNEDERCQEPLMYDFCAFGSCWIYTEGKVCCLQECSKRGDGKDSTLLLKWALFMLVILLGYAIYVKYILKIKE